MQTVRDPLGAIRDPRGAIIVHKAAASARMPASAGRQPQAIASLLRLWTYRLSEAAPRPGSGLAGQVQFHPHQKRGRTKYEIDPLLSLLSTLLTMPLSQRGRHPAVFLLSLLPFASF